jgi:tetratricopeptide (TPR) repeat protein
MRPLFLAVVAIFAQDSGPASQPSDHLALNSEALRLVEAKRFDEALAMIERARKLAPNEEVIVTNVARILTRRAQARFEGGDSDAAEADLVAALEAAPKEVISRVQLALILRSRGDLDRARKQVQRALVDEPSCAAAFEELARISYEEEDLIGAGEALETALKLDPSRKAALQSFREKLEKEAKIESAWYRAERGAFVVKYDDQRFKDVGETVLGYLDAAEARARATFGQVPSRRVTLVLYGQQDFTATTGAHGWAGGLFDGKIRLPVRNFAENRESIRRTIAHEYTHLVVRELNRKCPLWLNEGLAQLAEEKPLQPARDLLRSQKEPRSVKTMPASWMGIQDARLVSELYAQALLFTSHVVAAIGYQGIKDVLLKCNGGVTFESAFQQVAGKTLEETEAEWRAAR